MLLVAYPRSQLDGLRKPPSLDVAGRWLPYIEATIGWTTPFSPTGSPAVVLPTGIEIR